MRFIFLCCLLLWKPLSASYLTPNEIEQYYEQGYFMKKGALSTSEIEEMETKSSILLERIIEEIQDEKYVYPNSDQKIYIDGTQIVFSKNEKGQVTIKRMVGCGSIEPAFHKVLCSNKMQSTSFKSESN